MPHANSKPVKDCSNAHFVTSIRETPASAKILFPITFIAVISFNKITAPFIPPSLTITLLAFPNTVI